MGPKLIGSLETMLNMYNIYLVGHIIWWKSLCKNYCFVVFISVKILKHGVMDSGFLHIPHQIPVNLCGILFALISDHDLLQAKQGLLGFHLLPSFLGISLGRCKSMAIGPVPCLSFCVL